MRGNEDDSTMSPLACESFESKTFDIFTCLNQRCLHSFTCSQMFSAQDELRKRTASSMAEARQSDEGMKRKPAPGSCRLPAAWSQLSFGLSQPSGSSTMQKLL